MINSISSGDIHLHKINSSDNLRMFKFLKNVSPVLQTVINIFI